MKHAADIYKAVVTEAIELEKITLHQLSDTIWLHPELNYEEHLAHDTLTDFLEAKGFAVERSYLLPTSFRAEFVNSRGDNDVVVCIMCEYDALPELGHGCGHNLMAELGVAAAVGVKAAMKTGSIPGKLVVMGTPAEEGGGGKVALIKMGAFEDIQFALLAHPTNFDILEVATLAVEGIVVRYFGHESNALDAPWDGRSSLDAVVECYRNISLYRQEMKSTWRVHGIISKGGTTVNVVPGESELVFNIRTPTVEELDELRTKVVHCFEAAAQSTGCKMEYEVQENSNYNNLLLNHPLLDVYRQFAEEEHVDFIPDPGAASTDVGNVSHVIPCIQPAFAIPTKGRNHTKEFAEASGSTMSQMPTLRTAKFVALTSLEILLDPKLRKDANDAFAKSKQKGI